jgi:hypothetical protein
VGPRNPLSSKAFAGFSHPPDECKNLQPRFHSGLGIAKTRAPPMFCSTLPPPPAQNPVTRLWTVCTPLKIKQIKARTFY